MERHCPRPGCHLPESLMDTCINRNFAGNPAFQCPEPQESDPGKDVHISCSLCEKRIVVPIGRIMRGGASLGSNCQSDTCQAIVVGEVALVEAEASVGMGAEPVVIPEALDTPVLDCLESFLADPPDSSFQKGYLAFALELDQGAHPETEVLKAMVKLESPDPEMQVPPEAAPAPIPQPEPEEAAPLAPPAEQASRQPKPGKGKRRQ